jgi:hypothetical protein
LMLPLHSPSSPLPWSHPSSPALVLALVLTLWVAGIAFLWRITCALMRQGNLANCRQW